MSHSRTEINSQGTSGSPVPSTASSQSLTIRKALEMEYRYLGTGCGLRVSSLCLGTATFGPHPAKPKQCTEEEPRDIMDAYVEAGGNFIDTADWCGRTQTV